MSNLTNETNDRGRIVYYLFMCLGMAILLPWNAFVSSTAYFIERTYTVDFARYLAACAQTINLIILFVFALPALPYLKNYLIRLIPFCLAASACLAVEEIAVFLAEPSCFVFKLGVFFGGIVVAICTSLLNAGVYQLVGAFPPTYTNAIILGTNFVGLVVSFFAIITKFLFAYWHWQSNLTMSVCVFSFAALFCLFTWCLYLGIARYNRFFVQKNLNRMRNFFKDSIRLATQSKTWPRLLSILNVTWPYLFAIWLNFASTLLVFPTYLVQVQRIHEHNDTASGMANFFAEYHVDLIIVVFNFCAVVGNLLASGKYLGPGLLMLLTCLRAFLSLAFYAVCNFAPMMRSHIYITNNMVFWCGLCASTISFSMLTSMLMVGVVK